jgi:CheY-like chemotaxis protein
MDSLPTNRPASRPRILLAEDEDMVRDTLRLILTQHGYEVTAAVDGLDALRSYQAAPAAYALVVLDLSMPDVDGLEAMQRIHAFDPSARILLLSGAAPPDEPHAAFLPKPFANADLLRAVEELIHGAEPCD